MVYDLLCVEKCPSQYLLNVSPLLSRSALGGNDGSKECMMQTVERDATIMCIHISVTPTSGTSRGRDQKGKDLLFCVFFCCVLHLGASQEAFPPSMSSFLPSFHRFLWWLHPPPTEASTALYRAPRLLHCLPLSVAALFLSSSSSSSSSPAVVAIDQTPVSSWTLISPSSSVFLATFCVDGAPKQQTWLSIFSSCCYSSTVGIQNMLETMWVWSGAMRLFFFICPWA